TVLLFMRTLSIIYTIIEILIYEKIFLAVVAVRDSAVHWRGNKYRNITSIDSLIHPPASRTVRTKSARISLSWIWSIPTAESTRSTLVAWIRWYTSATNCLYARRLHLGPCTTWILVNTRLTQDVCRILMSFVKNN